MKEMQLQHAFHVKLLKKPMQMEASEKMVLAGRTMLMFQLS